MKKVRISILIIGNDVSALGILLMVLSDDIVDAASDVVGDSVLVVTGHWGKYRSPSSINNRYSLTCRRGSPTLNTEC